MLELLKSVDALTLSIVAGAATSVLTLVVRKVITKFGYEMGRNITLVLVFVVCLLGALVSQYAPAEMVSKVLPVFTMAVTFYQVVIKNVISIIDYVAGKTTR